MMMRKFHLVAIALVVVAVAMLTWTPVPKVDAQFAGANAFQVPFTLKGPLAVTTIPPCIAAIPTSTRPCIPNHNQLGHTITFTWTATIPNNFYFLFDGSNDNVNWVTLAAGTVINSSAAGGAPFSNGYFTYLRIKLPAMGANETFSAVYTGFAQPLPINPMADATFANTVTGVTAISPFASPYLLLGFQCFNPNGATAYLQLFKNDVAPTLGSGFIYQVGIPAGQAFVYPGPPLAFKLDVASGALWAGAATAAGGNTAVGSALPCTFEMNSAGPFYPFTPASP